jgi:hypothetical protein
VQRQPQQQQDGGQRLARCLCRDRPRSQPASDAGHVVTDLPLTAAHASVRPGDAEYEADKQRQPLLL